MIWHLTWAHWRQQLLTEEDNHSQPSNLTALRVYQVTLSVPQYISDNAASNMGAIKGQLLPTGDDHLGQLLNLIELIVSQITLRFNKREPVSLCHLRMTQHHTQGPHRLIALFEYAVVCL